MLYDKRWEAIRPEAKLKSWRQLLLEAAALIEKYGWVQGRWGSTKMGFCALGAMSFADHNLNSLRFAKFHLEDYTKFQDVTFWNDMRERTKAEVIAALRAAAAD